MNMPYIQDPSVNGCAAALINEAMHAIEVRVVSHGVPFFQARAEVLQASADEWVRLYGKETADLASKGVHAISQREMISRDGKRRLRDSAANITLWSLERQGGWRNSRLNRWHARTFGTALYGVLVVAGGLLLQHSPLEARDNSRQRAACSEARGQDAHERRCWRFDAGERAGHDVGDRASRAEWERSRPWEE